jgi:antirestriction protein ArdC
LAYLKHANQIGGHVKANEKGTPIVAFKIVNKETLVNGKKETSAYPMIKHHYVYNVAQCEDITIPAYLPNLSLILMPILGYGFSG